MTLSYTYDPSHDRLSLTDSLSTKGVISYSYDSDLRLTTLTQSFSSGGSGGLVTGPEIAFAYDSGGRLTSIARTTGSSGSTALNTSFTYDNTDRLTTIIDQVTNVSGGGSGGGSGGSTVDLATFTYNYDSGGRVSSEFNSTGTYTYNATYTYDSVNELTNATATLDGNAANTSYGYDANGNRNTTGYTVGVDNEITSGGSYTYSYDLAGNTTGQTQLSSGDVWSYSYDDRNRLTGVTERASGGAILNQATYTYDALDRRISLDDNGTQIWTVYDGHNPYADFTGSGSLAMRYLDGGAIDQIFARTNSAGVTAWYLDDHLGSVRDLVSITSGGFTVLDHVDYDAYGNIILETSPSNGDRF